MTKIANRKSFKPRTKVLKKIQYRHFRKNYITEIMYLHQFCWRRERDEDTNHIYRRYTDYNKIIRNAKAFIKSGGERLGNL